MTFAVGRISKCTLKSKLLVFLFCSPEVGLSYHVKFADRSAPSPNLRVSENRPIVIFEEEQLYPEGVETVVQRVISITSPQTLPNIHIPVTLAHRTTGAGSSARTHGVPTRCRRGSATRMQNLLGATVVSARNNDPARSTHNLNSPAEISLPSLSLVTTRRPFSRDSLLCARVHRDIWAHDF